ncbi:hypothetical protein [Clostridium sp.]|jgi:hypothetical protein
MENAYTLENWALKVEDNMPIIKEVTLLGGEPFESATGLSKLSEE